MNHKQQLPQKREDYRQIRLTAFEWAQQMTAYAVIDAVFSCLFFRSLIAFVLGLAFFPVYIHMQKKALLQKRVIQMREQFLLAARLTAGSMQAGYSPENAFREALPELQKVYDRSAFIVTEYTRLASGLSLHIPLEELLADLAGRSGVEDIERFTEVFITARRSGGDLAGILLNTTEMIRAREETRKEIETMLAGRAMEQTMMAVIPLCILAYVGLASPGFMEPMYHTLPGVLIMAASLGIYAAGWLWGRHIIHIEV